MNDPPPDPKRARLDRLLSRLLGGLLLLGGAVLLAFTLLTTFLPRGTIDGASVLLLPGTGGRHGLSPLAVPVLGSGALMLGLGGLAALAARRRPRPAAVPVRKPRPPSFRRPAMVLLAGVTLLVVALLRR